MRSENYERTVGFARQAFERLVAEHLPPNPENFAIWYAYYSVHIPELVQAIDQALADGQTITEDFCVQIHQRFLSLEAEARAIRESAEKTQVTLGRLLGLLETVNSDAGRYGQHLDGWQDQLAGPVDAETLRGLITLISAETKSVAEQHGRLQNHLVASARQIAESAQRVAEMRERLDNARKEAMTDALTGINNRKAFDETLASSVTEAEEQDKPLGLLMVDIDFFKKFNDLHGHLVGDLVLKLVARVLTECIKGRDTAARFGGEEFAIILPQTALANAVKVAEQVRLAVGSRQIINRSKHENYGNITLSIGVAEYRVGEPLDAFIQRADNGLYLAKRSGRNRVCAWTEDVPPPVS